MKYWLIILPFLALACGIMPLTAKSDVLPTVEIPHTPAKKQVQEATSQPSQVIYPVLCVSAAETLNLRIAPSTMAAADPDGLQHGDRVTVIGHGAGWYHIAVSDGKSGWVHGDYLEACE